MSEKRLRELFGLSPAQQIRHWAGPDPWNGLRLDNKVEISMNAVLRDADCNIIRMPLFMKPCFGQPLAFARHGGQQPIFHPKFGTVKSRCMRCQAKDACDQIAKARLTATSDIRGAFVRFGQAGGSFGLKNPSVCPTAQREFDGLVAALISHGGFTSINDVAALTELDRREAERKRRDAEKKRLARRKAIKRGIFVPEFLDLLERERVQREFQLVLTTSCDGLPPNLNRMPVQSAQITADVWFVRECKRIRGEKINPSSVARALIERWPNSYPKARFNTLRQRTGADLDRVATLERHIVKGFKEPIWPRFDLAVALNELDAVTPYTP
ncbi:hypothetical protein [Erythrobacter aurantius]|uniref:hypothetical protein n=1 Tax=Erythrobacter aurantius TaxID=2909249 RepID=UPI00207AAA8E|nr:hypothetical protein [Erythrobacter aurantius]